LKAVNFFADDATMQDVIEKLLTLQDRDRRLMRVKDQLARVAPERQMLQDKAAGAKAGLEAVKAKIKLVEIERKKLELEADLKKQERGIPRPGPRN
jgi:predicted nuclease with TOPRIM domain